MSPDGYTPPKCCKFTAHPKNCDCGSPRIVFFYRYKHPALPIPKKKNNQPFYRGLKKYKKL